MDNLGRRLAAAITAEDATGARVIIDEWAALPGADPLETLAPLAAAGSDLATELVLEALDAGRVLHRFVAGMLLDEAAIDDVAQEALISIATSIGSFSGRSKFTTWVHQIARNRTVDHLRRRRETAPLTERDNDAGAAVRMSSMIATRVTVRDALAALPDLYRVPITLRDVDGHTYAEVADRLGLSVGTVKSQVSRGRAFLAARLDTDLTKPTG